MCPYCHQTQHPSSLEPVSVTISPPVDITSWRILFLPLIDFAMGAPLDFTIHFNFVNALGVRQCMLIESPTQWRRSFKLCMLISLRENCGCSADVCRYSGDLAGILHFLLRLLLFWLILKENVVSPAYVLRRRGDWVSWGCRWSCCRVAGLEQQTDSN